jgi:hypothetical protein
VAAGLFTRALNDGARTDPGFEPNGVATAYFNAESWGYDSTKADRFFRALRERVGAMPGVTATSYTDILPLTMSNSDDFVRPEGPGTDGDGVSRVRVGVSAIDPGYFDVVRIPIQLGRAVVQQDDATSQKVVVVNETLANRLWPGTSAIGRTLGFHGERVLVVGVARDSKYGTLTERKQPFVYVPLAQYSRPDQRLIVRTAVDPAALGANDPGRGARARPCPAAAARDHASPGDDDCAFPAARGGDGDRRPGRGGIAVGGRRAVWSDRVLGRSPDT